MKWRGLKRTLSEFRRRPILHLLSICTLTCALLIVGAGFFVVGNIESIAEKTSPSMSATLYLKDDISDEQAESLTAALKQHDTVKSVQFRRSADVVRELEGFLGNENRAFAGLDSFPDLVEVELKEKLSKERVAGFREYVAQRAEVVEADFSDEWLFQYKRLRRFLRWGGLAVLFAIIVGCGFIIANFMGMRYQSRRREIEIVSLVGASSGFVFAPIIWEGLIEAAVALVAALVTLSIGSSALAAILSPQWQKFLGVAHWSFLSVGQVLFVAVVAAAMSLLGSAAVFFRMRELSDI